MGLRYRKSIKMGPFRINFSKSRMKDKNKVPFGSRDAAISAGYDPCDNCTP